MFETRKFFGLSFQVELTLFSTAWPICGVPWLLIGVEVAEVIWGYCCVLLYCSELCAFIAGKANIVLLLESFDSFLVCVADVRPLLLWLKCP